MLVRLTSDVNLVMLLRLTSDVNLRQVMLVRRTSDVNLRHVMLVRTSDVKLRQVMLLRPTSDVNLRQVMLVRTSDLYFFICTAWWWSVSLFSSWFQSIVSSTIDSRVGANDLRILRRCGLNTCVPAVSGCGSAIA